jgi:threonylcarbamoyladenosine tRNA methylthiotransferase MtaB
VKYFSENEYKEVVLSGIDITSYGADLPDKIDLADVLIAIFKECPKIERVRLSSVDPAAISDNLLEIVATEPRIMPHLHLSVQSGDNDVLRRMGRRHSREGVISLCERLRARRPEIIFGADLIAGFPTETDSMFQNTVDLIDEAGLSLLHIFPYSVRRGTVAASMLQLPQVVIKQRASLLQEKYKEVRSRLFKQMLGREVRCLIEGTEGTTSFGKTDQFINVRLNSVHRPGEVIQAIAQAYDETNLLCSANGRR